jgi:hypothetical protein
MAITDKTRKTLWARSGNRCAMCRIEIVAEQNEHDKNLNIGDECHIVSSQPNGPRHIPNYKKDYDSYDNLILLCKNHHRTIDELWETYTIDLLETVKKNHESWIRTVIDNAHKNSKADMPKFLPRLTTGKQIVDIVCDAHAYQFDHDEFKSQEEADFISGLLQNIQDWGEVSGFGDFEIGKRVQLGCELNRDIEELENRGFFIFGERRRSKMTNANKDDLGVWDIATIVILRQDNSAILNAEKLATQVNFTKA